jgi:hypothetical protein
MKQVPPAGVSMPGNRSEKSQAWHSCREHKSQGDERQSRCHKWHRHALIAGNNTSKIESAIIAFLPNHSTDFE